MKTVQEIADFLGGTLRGDGTTEIHTVGSLEHAQLGAIAYAEQRYLDAIPQTGASCVLIPQGDFPGQTVIVVKQPRVAFAHVANWLFPQQRPFDGVHTTAVVNDKAVLAADVAVGAWTVIESGVKIDSGTVIFPGCYIGCDCQIGRDCIVYPLVVLYPGVEIADRVTLHSGAVLGSDGFGFVFDGTRQIKVPQVGRLHVDSNVEIGANTCIDRGALDDTELGEGVKIDNLCQVGHNVQIGNHTTISSQTGIAGSSTIGTQATIGGQVGIADYCRIDDHGIVGAQCGVPSRKRIPPDEAYWGTPARPLKDVKLQQAHLSRLPKMAEEVKRLRGELDELRSKLEASVD